MLTVAVDWEVIRDDTDRAEIFTPPVGLVADVPVEDMEARYDSNTLQPVPAAAAEGGRRGAGRDRCSRSGSRTSPACRSSTEWRRTYPYAPLASHVVGYMGAITAEDEQHYEDHGYDTSVGGEDVGQSASS